MRVEKSALCIGYCIYIVRPKKEFTGQEKEKNENIRYGRDAHGKMKAEKRGGRLRAAKSNTATVTKCGVAARRLLRRFRLRTAHRSKHMQQTTYFKEKLPRGAYAHPRRNCLLDSIDCLPFCNDYVNLDIEICQIKLGGLQKTPEAAILSP